MFQVGQLVKFSRYAFEAGYPDIPTNPRLIMRITAIEPSSGRTFLRVTALNPEGIIMSHHYITGWASHYYTPYHSHLYRRPTCH